MLTACILAYNEEHCIGRTLDSLKGHVSNIIVVNDSSTDKTVEIAKSKGATVLNLPWRVSEKGFGKAVNWMLAQATTDWVLLIDADEIIPEIDKIYPLLREPDKFVWALPRRKWEDFDKKVRTEYEAYPDWQIRLINTNKTYTFTGEMHIRFTGERAHKAYRGPHIDHLQDQYRTKEKVDQRKELYTNLAATQGVAVKGGKTLAKE